jgi:alpha-tubulin suppressor-like RCC1 family protein
MLANQVKKSSFAQS